MPWLPGRAAADPLDPAASGNLDLDAAAKQLGTFVAALREADPAGGPLKDGTGRGVPLTRLDRSVREAIAASGTRIDGRATTRAWERALEADPYDGPPRWLHGDLMPGNLLVQDGRLTAVIDWGALGLGDPAADLTPAWQLFSGRSRAAFREASGVGHTLDDAAWERGKGWVLMQAVAALPYYWDRWPTFARASQRRIAALLDDA